jgi:hypothetical protein
MSDDDIDDVPEDDPETEAFAEAEAANAKNKEAFQKGIERLNRKYTYILARPDAVLDLNWIWANGGRTRILALQDFHNVEAPHRIEIKSKRGASMMPLSKLWFSSTQRRTYIDADYYGPRETPPKGHLNLYHGPAILPVEGKWPLTEDFLKNIICAGDQKLYIWFLALLQWKIQNPTANPEVGFLLLGLPGVGKGTLAHFLKQIFGVDHFLQFTDAAQAQNRFNSIIVGRFVLFYDETFYGHDPKLKQKLRGEITEPTVTIEAKFVNPFPMRNTALRIFASNEVAALPIDANDRRVVVFACAATHQNDFNYFAGLRKAMENGEVAAFVYDAQKANLKEFEQQRRRPPETEAKAKLALITGNPVATFLYHILRSDVLPGIVRPVERIAPENRQKSMYEIWHTGAVYIEDNDLYHSYQEYMKREHSARKPVSKVQFLEDMRSIIPRKEFRSMMTRVHKKPLRYRRFPSRKDGRAYWEKYARNPVKWEIEEDPTEFEDDGKLDLEGGIDHTRGGAPPPKPGDYGR